MKSYSNTVPAGSTVRVTVDSVAQRDFNAECDYLREDGTKHSWSHAELVHGDSAITLASPGEKVNGVVYLSWIRPSATTVTIEVVDDGGGVAETWVEEYVGAHAGAFSMLPIWAKAR